MDNFLLQELFKNVTFDYNIDLDDTDKVLDSISERDISSFQNFPFVNCQNFSDDSTSTIEPSEDSLPKPLKEESLPQTLEEFSPIHIKHGVINFSVRKILESSETFVPVDASRSFKFQDTNFLETGKSESESQVSNTQISKSYILHKKLLIIHLSKCSIVTMQ